MNLRQVLGELIAFRDAERWTYSGDGNNLFNVSIRQPTRYLEFLAIVAERHSDRSRIYADSAKSVFGVRKGERGTIAAALIDQVELDMRLLQLETESFYIFSSIYLGKIANFIEDYFGVERGVPLHSHSDLLKNFAIYAERKSISHTQVFLKDLAWMKTQVVDTRDKIITHQKNPRTLHGGSRDGSISLHFFMPREADKHVSTPELKDVSESIAVYTRRVMKLLKNNKAKSRFLAFRT